MLIPTFRRLVAAWGRAAGQPGAAVGVIVVGTLAVNLAITATARIPEPRVHDELTMVTMADIFANGRLCDPPHTHWQHFEANYLLARPCTQGKYPPGLPLYMALGRVLTGEFITGVWLSVVVMIVSSAYAMYGGLPARWALVGTGLVALRFGIAGDWASSYWGGSVAAAGGALVFGAASRLTTRPAARDGALFGAGVVMLAFSRPYEGLLYSLPAVALVVLRLLRPWPERARLWRTMPALLAIAAAGLGWLAYYNARVTGSPLVLPYALYERTYSAAPLFVFQDPRPAVTLRNPQMAGVEEYLVSAAQRARTNWPLNKLTYLGWSLWDFVKPTLAFALLGLIGLRRWRAARQLAWLTAGFVIVGFSLESSEAAPRHLAPMTVSIFALVTMGLAGLTRRLGPRLGQAVAAGIVAMFVAAVGVSAARRVPSGPVDAWWSFKRDIREQLLASAGDDLVFVRYKPSHDPHTEWIYNGADIDRQPIVWARELDAASDANLRAYFKERNAWVVLADTVPPALVEWDRLGQP